MDKKELLYKYFKEHTTLTSKEAVSKGYARIYLSMLESEGKIFKVARGVYSTNKNEQVNPLYEFQKNNKKVIYSHFSALFLLGVYNLEPKKIQISVPQGYNASRYINNEVFYNSLNNYAIGTTIISYKGKSITVYDFERTICDIIKDESRFQKQDYNRLINYYFNLKNINYSKLLEYSKLLKVSKKVQMYLSLFKA